MNLTFQKLGNDADQYAIYNEGTGETLAITHNDPGGERAALLVSSQDLKTVLLEVLAAMLPECGERSAILKEIGAHDGDAESDGDLYRISSDDQELAHWRAIIRRSLKI